MLRATMRLAPKLAGIPAGAGGRVAGAQRGGLCRSLAAAAAAPQVLLYQYEVCPYCCATKAFLDHRGLAYSTVEVNPLTKAQIKADGRLKDYLKVPVAVVDGKQVNDSREIVATVRRAVDGTDELSEREQEYMGWAHDRFVKLLPANLYRNLGESFEAFRYISEHKEFSLPTQMLLRAVGSLLMWAVQGRLKRKYDIGDERQDLYTAAREWSQSLGDSPFNGGDKPNMADITVFGMIRSMSGMQTYRDLMEQRILTDWYQRMEKEVGPSARIVE